MDGKTPDRLERLADKKLLTSGTSYLGSTLRTEHNLKRHIQRQKKLDYDAHANGNLLDERDTDSPEEKLVEKENQRGLQELLVDVLALFSGTAASDKTARKVLAVGLMMDCYEDTKMIARATRLSEITVKTAKQRIKYKLTDKLRREFKSILKNGKEVR